MSTPPRSAIVQPGVAGQLVAGTHARREDHQTGVDGRAVAQRHPQGVVLCGPPDRPVALCRLDGLGADARVHRDAEVADHPAQQRTAGLVELLGHQPRRHLDDVGMQAERCAARWRPPVRAGHRRSPRPPGSRRVRVRCGVGADRVEVVECAVDVAARQVVAGHRRHEGIGARGEHQRVVVDAFAVGGDDGLGGPVDRRTPERPAAARPGRRRRSRCRAARAGRGPSARCSR